MNFKPWIGSRYADRELFGLRILVLGESHYGKPGEAHENFTVEVVKWLGQRQRNAFFTTIAKFLLGMVAGEWLSDDDRKDFWEKVAFYNYVQEIVGSDARIRPTPKMWDEAKLSFLALCNDLRPELIVVLGKELCWNLPEIPDPFVYCCVRHPSAGFSYERERPILLDAVARAKLAANLPSPVGLEV